MYEELLACINPFCADPCDYAQKYLRAADELVISIKARSLPIDAVAHPIAFLYRHAMELSLKGFIATGNRATSGVGLPPSGHDLAILWSQAEPFVDRFFLVFNPTEQPKLRNKIEAVDRIIAELHQVDRGSFSFRYPTTKDKKYSLPGVLLLSLGRISFEVHEAIELLGWIADSLGCS